MRRMIELFALQSLIAIIGILSMESCARICRFLAWLVADVVRFRQRVIRENLQGVFPGMDDEKMQQTTRQMWYHLILMVCQVIHAPRKIHDTNWRKYVHIRDKQLMTSYLIGYRPLVLVSGHFGNFEMGGYVTGLLGMPSHTVARTLDNPDLDHFVNQFRARNGQFILPKDGSAEAVKKVLDGGGILTILGDQHAGTKGCWIDFLGRPAACHKAIALFTLSANAPMMVSYCRQLSHPFRFEIGCTGVADPLDLAPELRDVTSLTQWYNDRMGEAIFQAPEQFWWVHRRWKDRQARKKGNQIAT